jgi:hypothetical protein
MLPLADVTYRTTVALIFDVEDAYARDVRFRSRHPRPIEPLDFWLVGQVVGGARQDFPTPVQMLVSRNASGYHLFFGELRYPNGALQTLPLAAGTYVVRVAGPYYQMAERADIVAPMPDPNRPSSGAPYTFDLAPGYAYPFPQSYVFQTPAGGQGCAAGDLPGSGGPTLLRGCLFAPNGAGIAGATVQAGGFPAAYLTDDTGQWVLPFAESSQPIGLVALSVRLPDGSTVNVPDVCVARGRETRLGATVLQGQVLKTGRGVAGAVITIENQPGQTVSATDGEWSYYFGPGPIPASVKVTATLPGGASKSVSQVGVKRRVTTQGPVIQFR